MKVLIVEDDDELCSTIEFALTKNGHEVVATAGDGIEAVEKYKETRPRLVIMDIILPKKHGIETIGDIIKINSDAKIMVITGASHESLITDALNAGAFSYLTKPFGAKELLDEIGRIPSQSEDD